MIHTRSSIVNIVGCLQDLTEINGQPNVHNMIFNGGFNQNIIIERLQLTISPLSPLVGFIKTQGAESGVVIEDVRIQGYLETSPQNTMLEPEYLFSIEGFIHFQDVVIEHIYLRSGSIIQVIGLRRSADDSRMEWLGKTSIGLYSCTFDDVTSNETSLIILHEKDLENNPTLSNKNQINSILIDNSEKTTKFIIQDTIFSNCSTSLHWSNQVSKGGLINVINKKVKLEILNSEFRNIQIKARNMIYLGWSGKEPNLSEMKLLTITETLIVNCSSVIPDMKVLSPPAEQFTTQMSNIQSEIQEIYKDVSHELYEDGAVIYDSVYKHGLIHIDNQNKLGDSISLAFIDVKGIFVSGCHSAVGSAFTIKGLTVEIIESVFIQPLCYGNMIYLNQTRSTLMNCYFKGYNGTFINLPTISGAESQINSEYQSEESNDNT
ncbi:MAG: hypothetical protein EZS28_045185, partial [Streblomastix strix]